MRVSDLVRAAGGLRESAYIEGAELSRQIQFASGGALAVNDTVNLSPEFRGDADADVTGSVDPHRGAENPPFVEVSPHLFKELVSYGHVGKFEGCRMLVDPWDDQKPHRV